MFDEDNPFRGKPNSIVDAVSAVLQGKPYVAETNKNDKSDDGEGLDDVQKDAVKKKFKDRKDKDIDNDGDVDGSDKFLHKKRKAITKAIDKEDDVDEGKGKGKKYESTGMQHYVDAIASHEKKSNFGRAPRDDMQEETSVPAGKKAAGKHSRPADKEAGEKAPLVKQKEGELDEAVLAEAAFDKWLSLIGEILSAGPSTKVNKASQLLEDYINKFGRSWTGFQKLSKLNAEIAATFEEALDVRAGMNEGDELEEGSRALDLSGRRAGPMNKIFGKSAAEKEAEKKKGKKEEADVDEKYDDDGKKKKMKEGKGKKYEEVEEGKGKKYESDDDGDDDDASDKKVDDDGVAKKKKGGKDKKDEVDVEPQHDEVPMANEKSDAMQARKEKIVKGMKKKADEFKAKYGDRAKEVMHATATKMAKREGIELTDDDLQETTAPFDGGKKVSVKKDKFGNVVKDKNRPKSLARQAMQAVIDKQKEKK